MLRAGRPRKDTYREPNGKPQRDPAPTATEQHNARNAADTLAQQMVVLSQPHRNSSAHKWRASALGRFLLDRNIQDVHLFAGVEAYVSLKRNWAIAQCAPRGFANPPSSRQGDGEGPDEATVRGWLAQYVAIDRMLVRVHGSIVFKSIVSLAYADQDLSGQEFTFAQGADGWRRIVDGMLDVAIEMGTKPARMSAF